MGKFRSVLFWIHLTAGVVGGVVILIMSATGVLLTLQQSVLRTIERSQRYVEVPAAGAVRVPVETLIANVKQAFPDAAPATVTFEADPRSSVAIAIGAQGTAFVNPYTGVVLGTGSARARGFYRSVTNWHRYLAMTGEGRATGRAITGACNAAFLVLAVSGLYLWLPRQWTWRHVGAVTWFRGGLRGKARDFNWHNSIGFWSAPVLIVLTTTGMVISYAWASNLVYTVTGSPRPVAAAGRGAGPGSPSGPEGRGGSGRGGAERAARGGGEPGALREARAGSGASRAGETAATASGRGAEARMRGGDGDTAGRASGSDERRLEDRAASGDRRAGERATSGDERRAEARAPGDVDRRTDGGAPGSGEQQAPFALIADLTAAAARQVPTWSTIALRLPARPGATAAATIADGAYWNRFARSTLTLDSRTAVVVKWEPYAATSAGQKLRGWMRFAHTGELGGVAGELVAGLACLGGGFLVWTGLALSLRRFAAWRARATSRARLGQVGGAPAAQP